MAAANPGFLERGPKWRLHSGTEFWTKRERAHRKWAFPGRRRLALAKPDDVESRDSGEDSRSRRPSRGRIWLASRRRLRSSSEWPGLQNTAWCFFENKRNRCKWPGYLWQKSAGRHRNGRGCCQNGVFSGTNTAQSRNPCGSCSLAQAVVSFVSPPTNLANLLTSFPSCLQHGIICRLRHNFGAQSLCFLLCFGCFGAFGVFWIVWAVLGCSRAVLECLGVACFGVWVCVGGVLRVSWGILFFFRAGFVGVWRSAADPRSDPSCVFLVHCLAFRLPGSVVILAGGTCLPEWRFASVMFSRAWCGGVGSAPADVPPSIDCRRHAICHQCPL